MARGKVVYTEEQKNRAVELAQEVGIAKAIAELGYGSYNSLKAWARAAGVELSFDPIKARAAMTREFYKDEEKLVVCQEVIGKVYNYLQSVDVDRMSPLKAQDVEKLAQALQRVISTMQLIEGKATQITEDKTDDGFSEALAQFYKSDNTQASVSSGVQEEVV